MKWCSVLVLILTLSLVGCQPAEVTARDSIAAAKGFIEDQQKQRLQECTADKSKEICVDINKAVEAQNLAVTALIAYCSDATFANNSGPCHPNRDLQPKLQAAIEQLNNIVNSIKVLAGVKP
jgi:gamma-glutamyl:cysteine ligase YbdK (ATP-grasp superfamily)